MSLCKEFLNTVYYVLSQVLIKLDGEGTKTLADLIIESRGNSKSGSDSKEFLPSGRRKSHRER